MPTGNRNCIPIFQESLKSRGINCLPLMECLITSIYLLVCAQPNLSDLLQDIKRNSALWINQKGFVNGKFEWQEGYGAFSYSKSHVSSVINYIENQEEHHKKISFRDEYLEFLKK